MHTITKKIYYHDTDCGQVVYYANYLKYLEEARTEFMRDKGFDLGSLAQAGTWFVVRRVEIDYKAPARYGEVLTIQTELKEARNVSLVFSQKVNRTDTLLVEAVTQLVCVNTSFQPTVIPETLRQSLGGSHV